MPAFFSLEGRLQAAESTGALAATGLDATGSPIVALSASNFGIDGLGVPYFDPAGAVPAERAHLYIDGNGDFALIPLGG